MVMIYPITSAVFSLEVREDGREMACDNDISTVFSVQERQCIRSILDDARTKISEVMEIALARIEEEGNKA